MRDETLIARTIAGLKWNTIAVIGHAGASIAIAAVLARLLTPNDFGLAASALVVVGTASAISHRTIGLALVQCAEIDRTTVANALGLVIVVGAGATIAVWAGAEAGARLLGEPILVPILEMLAIVVALNAAATVPIALARRELQFAALARAELVARIGGYGGIGIGLAAAGAGVWALVGATVASAAVMTAMLLASAAKRLPRPRLRGRDLRRLRQSAGGFGAIAGWTMLEEYGTRLVIARTLGMTDLAFFLRAHGVAAVNGYVGRIVSNVLFPAAARRQHALRGLGEAYRRGAQVAVTAGLLITGLLVVCAEEAVVVVFGEQWVPSADIVQVLACATAVRFLHSLNAAITHAMGALRAASLRRGTYTCVLLAAIAAASHWGLTGVAIAAVAALGAYGASTTRLTLQLLALPAKDLARSIGPALWIGAGGALGAGIGKAAGTTVDAGTGAILAMALAGWIAGAGAAAWHGPRWASPDAAAWLVNHLAKTPDDSARRWLIAMLTHAANRHRRRMAGRRADTTAQHRADPERARESRPLGE